MKIYEPDKEENIDNELKVGMIFRETYTCEDDDTYYYQIHQIGCQYSLISLDGVGTYAGSFEDIEDVFGGDEAEFTRVHKVVIEN